MSNWSGHFMKKWQFREIFSCFTMCEIDVSTSGNGQFFMKKSISQNGTLLQHKYTQYLKIELYLII
jgi:hypothetical protein